MSAIVVRIAGPSYCGSTALGCAMNTAPGAFFGSEIYRYLASWRTSQNEGRFPTCDFCGPECDYWSDELRDELARDEVDSLAVVYGALLGRHPEITMLVDGSKSVGPLDDAFDVVISPRKHPMRLLASYVYNRRRRFDIETDGLEEVGTAIERSLERFGRVVESSAGFFLQRYRELDQACPGALLFRTDEAHEHDFAAFRRLERELGMADGSFDPKRFSHLPAHTIGGNRQPIWMSRRAHGRTVPTTPRTEYYDASDGIGDWKLDDKHRLVFPSGAVEIITRNAKYRALCELLEYDVEPAVSRVDTTAD